MGSFKGDKNKKPGRGRKQSFEGLRAMRPTPEGLEDRTLLSSLTAQQQQAINSVADVNTIKNGPVAKGGQDLAILDAAYQKGGDTYQQVLAAQKQYLVFRGDKVGVDVYAAKGGYDQMVTGLTNLGMEVVAKDPKLGIVEGYLPVGQLRPVAQMAAVASFSAIDVPLTAQQGVANNQADQALFADVARQQFGVDGTGVTIGVLSDSVSRFQGGLADSVATGDLPSNVNVLLDQPLGQPSGYTDEGRAMLELVHDIAPGSPLAFYTAFNGGPAGFGTGIRALANQADAKVIVDDVSYANVPVFQDSVVAQAVTDVTTNNNVAYFSSANNFKTDGIETNFRAADTNVAGVGTGRFLDFDPGPGVTTNLPITVNQGNLITLNWDAPWYNGAASNDLDIFVLDANNNIVSQGVANNIGSASPQEIIAAPGPGNYSVVVRVTAGADPSRVRVQAFGGDIDFSKQFGSAGTTTYPTTFGQSAAANAISVAAVPFFGAPPFASPNPINTEPFSSAGPVTIFFDPAGNRLPAMQLRLKPDVAGIDGVNTSFFGQDIPQDTDTLPNFFGTSAAAPNLAAVAALMKQLNPGANYAAIQDAMKQSTTPLNGAAPGSWDTQGGFGLVNAVKALTSVQQLRVVSTTPSNGATLASTPSRIVVNFNKPIDATSLQSSDLNFTLTPAGVTVAVGTPTLLSPTSASFPITVNAPNVSDSTNGAFAFQLADGSVTALSGETVVGISATYTVADVVAPTVTNTTLQGRIVVIDFSEPMRLSTLTKSNIQLVRTGGTGQFGLPQNVVVSDDPRAQLVIDQVNNRAILDLRDLPQTSLPSDIYALAVTDDVRDAAGNRLDGEYTGTFPTGNGTPGGTFVQPLGGRLVQAPQIINFGLAAGSDTGIGGDRTTDQVRPTFSGNVVAPFPATNAGLQIAVQFIQAHPGGLDLGVGANGQGYVGNPDLIITTNADGSFSFQPPFDLRDGFQRIRLVVVGASENPPLPGQASSLDQSFRVDTTSPLVTASSIPQDARIANLRDITLNVADPVAPSDPNDPLAVPPQLDAPALDPATANNVSNYSLINLGPDRTLGTPDDIDESSFIQSATFTSTSMRTLPTDPYTGRIELSFADGLPSGRYLLVARSSMPGLYQGIRDAAGNPLDNDLATPGNQSYSVAFDLQPEAAFITSYQALSPSAMNPGTTAVSGPRAFYEIPVPGYTPRAEAPPDTFYIDFSNTLAPRDYTNAVQLIRSADNPGASSDGDFGVGGGGSTQVTGLTVKLVNSIPGATLGQPGYQNRLEVHLAPGTTLPADYYRLVVPNVGDQAIYDIFGNQADLEFLGNQKANGSGYEDLMPNGTYRAGLTGDAVAGGSFVTGFVVVPGQRTLADGRIQGNIIYARPDYQDDPFLSSDDPNGSIAKPFPTLAPEAVPNVLNGGDLNSQANFGTGFNPKYDRNANGVFDRSAFVEAQQASAAGPVVVVALPGIIRPVPGSLTGETTQQTFVIAPPAGVDPTLPENNGSASVPAQTTLVFDPGTTLKLYNASLFVQNQGSALQMLGGSSPADQVVFTSLLDDSFGGDTNGDNTDTTPSGGDWGGVVFRNFDDVTNRGPNATPQQFPVDGRLGLSGASDVMSIVNDAFLRYGGGAVPQTIGTRYDSITLYNSRPAITNSTIADSAAAAANDPNASGTQAAISADLDSLREDMIARGPLIRRMNLINNSINGILLRPAIGTLQVQETNAEFYADNPSTLGAARNFTIDDPLPYVLASQMILGQRLELNTGNIVDEGVSDRLYVQPGMMVKFRPSASMAVVNTSSSINIGDRTYINEFDANPNISPEDPNFKPNTKGDAEPLFTSLYDDAAETYYFDPTTGVRRVIVPAGATDNSTTNPAPSPGNVDPSLRWGGLSITPGAVGVIDEAHFQYGGWQLTTPIGTLPPRQVLDLTDDLVTFLNINPGYSGPGIGANVSITNNDFTDNYDAPIVVEPNQLLAADPLRPLASGNPFFRGNVLQRNSINGLAIKTFPGISFGNVGNNGTDPFYIDGSLPANSGPNLNVNSVWDDTDIVHVLRGTVVLDGYSPFNFGGGGQGIGSEPVPDPTQFTPELKPAITLTVASALPDSLLADGERVARPGESMIVKLFNDYNPTYLGPGDAVDPNLADPASNSTLDLNQGAGFSVGYDNGVDPPANKVPDEGIGSQLRFIGIGANETTGQQRVPVIITSLRDSTVGPTVRGVDESNTFFSDPVPNRLSGSQLSTPAAGDGGVIAFGGMSLTDYNLFDPRDGNLITNADIKYITRIEMQGGGIFDASDISGDGQINLVDNWRTQKLGTDPSVQYNSAQSMTISNSNLSTFRDAGVFVWQGYDALVRQIFNLGGAPSAFGISRISGLRGQPTNLFMVNNTIANMPVGVRVNGPGQTNDSTGQSPATAVFLNNTFYNDGVGIHTETPAFNGTNSLSHVYFLGMDNIFDGGTIGTDPNAAAVRSNGQATLSELQFNLFNNYTTNFEDNTNTVLLGNNNPIYGDPKFFDALAGNFFIQAGSAAIDTALSELGPVLFGDALYPVVNQTLDASGGVRNTIGRTNAFGGLGGGGFGGISDPDPREIVSLPGTPSRSFVDQFYPVPPSTPGAIAGPATNVATPYFVPIAGERDLEGYLRVDDPNTTNLGFGSRPFFDVGAREYRILNPPHVTNVGAPDVNSDGTPDGVYATVATQTGTNQVSLYTPGGVVGTNTSPLDIYVQFDKQLDPQTVSNLTVRLEASGGDGIFGNNNSTGDRFIDLSGKLSFDPVTRRLHIALGSTNLVLANDLYQIILVGTGGNVLRDKQGNPLDGENGSAASPNALPSGNGFPGGNFAFQFTIDTNPPVVTPGSFKLNPADDAGVAGDQITNVNPPSFVGNIKDIFPPVNPLVGQTVQLDIDGDGNGTIDVQNIGQATTDAAGNFVVRPNVNLPDSPYNVGPDGILGTADDSGYSRVRVRVTDVAGNQSDPNDPNAYTSYIVDTQAPKITGVTPAPNSRLSPGSFTVSFTANENLLPSSLKAAGALTVTGAGRDGFFGTADDVQTAVDPNSIQIEYLKTDPKGPVRVSFDVSGASQNGVYRVFVAESVTDIAGNALDGEFQGSFPTGDGQPGGAFQYDLIVYGGGQTNTYFVDTNSTAANPDGSRAAPFKTIADGLAAAGIGDTVAVLPGTYNEAVTLKSLVRLVSAASSSTDGNVVQGRAQDTVIRAPINQNGPTVTVQGTDLLAAGSDLQTEFRGFTVASPLSGLYTGTILTDSVGLKLTNSAGLFHDNYFIDGAVGMSVDPLAGSAPNAQVQNNGFVGNLVGLQIDDSQNSSQINNPVEVVNNTFALNNVGSSIIDTAINGGRVVIGDLVNNIFWQNSDRSATATDTPIQLSAPVVDVRGNMFSSNPNNPLLGFPTNALGSTPTAAAYFNFTGDPAFAAARDPRPGFNGPTIFLLDANFGLTANSDAIDAALNSDAPATDFLGRGRVDVANRGFAGLGPADVGAFEFQGSGSGGVPTPGGPGGGSGGSGGGAGSGGGSGPVGLFGYSPVTLAQTASSVGTPSPASSIDTTAGYTVSVPTTVPQLGVAATATAGPARRYLQALKDQLGGTRNLGTTSAQAGQMARAWNAFLNSRRRG